MSRGNSVSVRYTERLAEIGSSPSIGTIGDLYDNSLAERFHGIYKIQLIRRCGPWRNAEHVELETLAFIEWFNHHRLHSELSHISSAEHEAHYRRSPTRRDHSPNTHPDLPQDAGRFTVASISISSCSTSCTASRIRSTPSPARNASNSSDTTD